MRHKGRRESMFEGERDKGCADALAASVAEQYASTRLRFLDRNWIQRWHGAINMRRKRT